MRSHVSSLKNSLNKKTENVMITERTIDIQVAIIRGLKPFIVVNFSVTDDFVFFRWIDKGMIKIRETRRSLLWEISLPFLNYFLKDWRCVIGYLKVVLELDLL